jgi:serine/threonine protein kinase
MVGYDHKHISATWSASVAMAGHIVPAIATPYYRNGDIFHYICLYPNADRLNIVYQAASAFAYIHSKDVVHGNICPVSFSSASS